MLDLYRRCLRSAARCPQYDHKMQMKAITRLKFKNNKHLRDPDLIASKLLEGEDELSQMNYYHSAREEKQGKTDKLTASAMSPAAAAAHASDGAGRSSDVIAAAEAATSTSAFERSSSGWVTGTGEDRSGSPTPPASSSASVADTTASQPASPSKAARKPRAPRRPKGSSPASPAILRIDPQQLPEILRQMGADGAGSLTEEAISGASSAVVAHSKPERQMSDAKELLKSRAWSPSAVEARPSSPAGTGDAAVDDSTIAANRSSTIAAHGNPTLPAEDLLEQVSLAVGRLDLANTGGANMMAPSAAQLQRLRGVSLGVDRAAAAIAHGYSQAYAELGAAQREIQGLVAAVVDDMQQRGKHSPTAAAPVPATHAAATSVGAQLADVSIAIKKLRAQLAKYSSIVEQPPMR